MGRAPAARRMSSYRVYRLKSSARGRIDETFADDILSRQSYQTRDAAFGGEGGDWVYLFVEGEEPAMQRADKMVLEFAEHAPDGARLHRKLKAEEDEAAEGLGSIFGDV